MIRILLLCTLSLLASGFRKQVVNPDVFAETGSLAEGDRLTNPVRFHNQGESASLAQEEVDENLQDMQALVSGGGRRRRACCYAGSLGFARRRRGAEATARRRNCKNDLKAHHRRRDNQCEPGTIFFHFAGYKCEKGKGITDSACEGCCTDKFGTTCTREAVWYDGDHIEMCAAAQKDCEEWCVNDDAQESGSR